MFSTYKSAMQLRWGICGCGIISGDFVNALALLPPEHNKVTAVGASSADRAKQFAERNSLEGCQYFGSYDELFACDQVDIIYIGVVSKLHYENALKSLKAGKHVLCEKPLGLNVAQTKELIACARKKKLFLMEALASRFFPVYKQIREEISSGNLGEIKFLIGDFGMLLPFKPGNKAVLVEEAHMGNYLEQGGGGGFLLPFGGYLIELAQMVFGGQKPTKISVDGWLHKNTGVDNTGSITLSYPNNKLAQILYTGAAMCECRVQVVGTKGRMMIPELFWCSTKVERQLADGSKRETFNHELPSKPGVQFIYPNSAGLSYQAECVRECLVKGLTECPVVSWEESVTLAEISEECRHKLGVKYSCDK